jgi:8-oxo-dGTP pyrophosphatase MutT (NUDIX family)
MEKGEKSARDVAVRETMEEVGIDLARSAEFLGYFEPHVTHTGTMNVVPSVYLMKRGVKPKLNAEVSSCRWVDLEELLAPRSQSGHLVEYRDQKIEMPAYLVGDYEVWGLTHRILTALLDPGSAKGR